MQIVHRPKSHTIHSLYVLLAIPVFLLNLWIMQKGPFVRLFDEKNLPWIILQAVWVLICCWWLLKAQWRGFWSLWLLDTLLLWGNLYFLVKTKNYALAFYALFLLTISILYFVHLYRILKESYYHSGRHWYESLPAFLPRIEVELWFEDKNRERVSIEAKLSRLGVEGCFAYPIKETLIKDRLFQEIYLKLNETKLSCPVELVCVTEDKQGAGLRFIADSEDQRKDIWDFIDRARSLGYVQ